MNRCGPAEAPRPDRSGINVVEQVNAVAAAASFFAVLMFYAGVMHSGAYYAYFRLRTFSLGFDFAELAIRSLRLVTLPVLIVLAGVVLILRAPELLASLGVPQRVTAGVRRGGRRMAQQHLLIVAIGVLLMTMWRYIQPYGWTAPVCVATGLLLGQCKAANPTGPAQGLWRAGVPIALAGVFLTWAVALAAGELGRRDAHDAAENLVRRTEVVVLSTERLSMTGRGLVVEDLGRGVHYRYRYRGLRLLIEHDKRYYVLPVGWQRRTDATYIIDDDDSIRIELAPGTQLRE